MEFSLIIKFPQTGQDGSWAGTTFDPAPNIAPPPKKKSRGGWLGKLSHASGRTRSHILCAFVDSDGDGFDIRCHSPLCQGFRIVISSH